MKKILILLPLLLLFSCSVQKRKYQKGYHFTWHKSAISAKERRDPIVKTREVKKEKPVMEVISNTTEYPELTVSKEDKIAPIEIKKKRGSLIGDDPCDVLIFKDGSEIKGKVVEITAAEIKYKKCEMLEGPTYVVKKTAMFMIKYANGTREVFKEEANAGNQDNPHKSNYKGPKKVHPLAIFSLIFGILGYFPLFIIGAILAIVFGNAAMRKIDAQPDMYKGDGFAIAGKTLGIVYLAILGFILVFYIVLLFLLI